MQLVYFSRGHPFCIDCCPVLETIVLLACRRLPAASSGGTACKKGANFPALPAVIGKPPPRKIGRPIAFTGDVNSKDLTEADRRRIKRCVSYT